MKHTFRALAARDFRLYFSGQAVSLIGTWVQQVALSWIAYRVTGSAFMLGLIAFSGQIPMLLLTPFGGALADRFNRRDILLVTQVIEMTVAILLAWVAWEHAFSEGILLTASIVLGISGAMEMPTRQAFIIDLLHDRSHMTNAIALNTMTFNSARLLGPALSGVLLAAFGEFACFSLNALSYLAAIYTLLAITPRRTLHENAKGSLLDALAYLREFAPARWLIMVVTGASIAAAPAMTLMPIYAKDIFRGGPDMLGTLMGAAGLGSLLASTYLANRRSVAGQGNIIVAGCWGLGLGLAAFAYNTLLTPAVLLQALVGASLIFTVASCNMLLQSMVPDHLRGRVMAIYTMAFLGILPIGSLVAGGIAHVIGVELVFVGAGLLSAVMGFVLRWQLPALRKAAHPVLTAKGMLPD